VNGENGARLIVISSPSGGGKTSVINYLMEKHPTMVHSISWTTRPPRPGQVDRGYYENVDPATFLEERRRGGFAEWAMVHDHFYGTPQAPLDQALDQRRNVLLDLDVVGGTKLKERYGDKAILIFLTPPSMDELSKRLAARATDSAEDVALRLENARKELASKDLYDYQVVNDVLEDACTEIERILGLSE